VSTKPFDQAFGAEQGRQIVKSEIAFFLSGQGSVGPAMHERKNDGQREPEQKP